MAIATTTLDQVESEIRSAINGITPRFQRGREIWPWTPYERKAQHAAKTRRYRIEWGLGQWTPGGLFGLAASDTTVELHVIVDYTVPEQYMAEVVEDDWWQLRDVLSALCVDGTKGMIQVDTQAAPAIYQEENKDHFQADMVYMVRYMKARA
jgi:hypothetical protein